MALDEVTSLPVWSPNSHYAKEMRKWEKPYRFEKFPQMLYKARKPDNGGPYLVIDPRNEAWSTNNQRTVGNEQEFEQALREGWREGVQAAIDYAKGLDQDIANAAAERAFADRKMSEAAQAEAKAADEATADHLPEIPEKRAYRRKAV